MTTLQTALSKAVETALRLEMPLMANELKSYDTITVNRVEFFIKLLRLQPFPELIHDQLIHQLEEVLERL